MKPLYDEQRENRTKKLLQTNVPPATEEEKKRVKQLTENLFKTMGKEFEFLPGESRIMQDHMDRDGAISYASAMKFKLKPIGYPRIK